MKRKCMQGSQKKTSHSNYWVGQKNSFGFRTNLWPNPIYVTLGIFVFVLGVYVSTPCESKSNKEPI